MPIVTNNIDLQRFLVRAYDAKNGHIRGVFSVDITVPVRTIIEHGEKKSQFYEDWKKALAKASDQIESPLIVDVLSHLENVNIMWNVVVDSDFLSVGI